MSDQDESVVLAAYEAYGRGEVNRLLELVHPDLEWTYLDPSMQNPQPQTCHGREGSWPGFWGSKPTGALSQRWRRLPPAATR